MSSNHNKPQHLIIQKEHPQGREQQALKTAHLYIMVVLDQGTLLLLERPQQIHIILPIIIFTNINCHHNTADMPVIILHMEVVAVDTVEAVVIINNSIIDLLKERHIRNQFIIL